MKAIERDPTSYYFSFPKWAALSVSSDTPLTPQQAEEVILRTYNFSWLDFSPTSKEGADLLQALSLPHSKEGPHTRITGSALQNLRGRVRSLDGLLFLQNHNLSLPEFLAPNVQYSWSNYQSWCHWDGTIQIVKNIGPWSCTGEIQDEWAVLAQAFPFLDLRCHIYNGEVDDNPKPILEFRVKSGQVSVHSPPNPPVIPLDQIQTVQENLPSLSQIQQAFARIPRR